MANENNEKRTDSVYSQRVRAGKRRTYFFDVRETRGNDYFLTITESRKKFNEDGYDRHKIFLYKEDFNKFLKGITDAINFVKTELMPDFDFDVFNHDQDENQPEAESAAAEVHSSEKVAEEPKAPESDAAPSGDEPDNSHKDEQVDKW